MSWNQRIPDPSPNQIEKRTANIRQGWNDNDYRRRFVGPVHGVWAIPIVNITDMPEGFLYDDGQDQTNPR